MQEFNEAASVHSFVASSPADPSSSESTKDGFDRLRQSVGPLVEQLVKHETRVTGLFVPNDLMTAIVYAELRNHGMKPGEEIELISCNNEQSVLIGLNPRPATIDVGAESIGMRAVEQLIWRMKHPNETRQSQLAVTPLLVES